jgi:hypothetical protein
MKISQMYVQKKVSGWLGEEIARQNWNLIGSDPAFRPFTLKTGDKQRMMLYEVVRKVLNKDTENYAQQVGDCVSFGMKNAIEYLQCCEILINGEREKFHNIFPPYLYGTGRVQIGGGRINGDGSLGSWMAAAVIKYGAIASKDPNVPGYSGNVARKWGAPPGPPTEFLNIGKLHLIKSAAQVTSWDQLVAAICNGYPCTVASDQGFNMEASSDGFHAARGSWAHQMCIIGIDNEHPDPYAIILNSWGDAHGRLKDFKTGEQLPIGVLRVRRKTIERMIGQQEVFAVHQYDGQKEQDLDKALFKLI